MTSALLHVPIYLLKTKLINFSNNLHYQALQRIQNPSDEDKRQKQSVRDRLGRAVINKDGYVIATTCVMAGSKKLQHVLFDTVVNDESSQSSLPEMFIPIVHGCQRLILIGDDKQLPPFSRLDNPATELFSILASAPYVPAMALVQQYRMNTEIMEWPSRTFYDNQLVCAVSESIRYVIGIEPVLVIDVGGNAEKIEHSFRNSAQVDMCLDRLQFLLNVGVDPTDIGIITPYEAQTKLCQQVISCPRVGRC
eukprot:Lithocolla_globosa_v1_NODE_663_length_3483_cov_6.183489.p2 type:complete len:251 gc:universal NODE_663_length_3483_cov_6.183489:1193-441(-)